MVIALPEHGGCAVFAPFEVAVEIGNVVETALVGDFGNGLGGVEQQAGGVSQADVQQALDKSEAGAALKEFTEGNLRHVGNGGDFRQMNLPLVVGHEVIHHPVHTATLETGVFRPLGKVEVAQQADFRTGGKLVENGKQLDYARETRFFVQTQDFLGHAFGEFFGEYNAPGRVFEHTADERELVAVEQRIGQQVVVKLDGDLGNHFRFALVCEPGVLDVVAHKHQIDVADHFHTVAHNAPTARGVDDQVKLVFLVPVQGKIEGAFEALKKRKAILLCEGNDFG